MREFKFRAWDRDKKRFWTQKEMNETGGFYYSYGLTPDEDDFDLMQYTGLKDKNGKEIYERDIVHKISWYANERMGKDWEVTGDVYYKKGIYFVRCSVFEGDQWNGGLVHKKLAEVVSDFEPEEFSCEIIGNIYENPELMEDK